MPSPALSARLKYLNDSAHLLATTDPGTSAYLMSRCNSLMFDNELDQTDAHRRHVCGACGNIMVLGWTGTRQLATLKAPKRRHNAMSKTKGLPNQQEKSILYQCEQCSRRTRQHINTIPPRPLKTLASQTNTNTSQTATSLSMRSPQTHTQIKTPGSALANASSRKRAKARKQGGLRALLAKKREADSRSSAGGFGLDLLDLMKKG